MSLRTSRLVVGALGIATLVPAIYLFVFMVSMFLLEEEARAVPIFGSMETLTFFHISVTVLAILTTLFYLIHAVRNRSLAFEAKALWVVVLVVANFLGAIAYWACFFWRPLKQKS